jgi:hypothetical protein
LKKSKRFNIITLTYVHFFNINNETNFSNKLILLCYEATDRKIYFSYLGVSFSVSRYMPVFYGEAVLGQVVFEKNFRMLEKLLNLLNIIIWCLSEFEIC